MVRFVLWTFIYYFFAFFRSISHALIVVATAAAINAAVAAKLLHTSYNIHTRDMTAMQYLVPTRPRNVRFLHFSFGVYDISI